jgi:flagellar assembly factor FliW
MQVRTTRFGIVDIEDSRVITFAKGLLGFSAYTRYCLLQPNDDAAFFWLQSVEEPSLAFVITDPGLFFPDYSAPIRPEQMEELALDSLDEAQVFVIVNKVSETLTANLQGPLVVNSARMNGEQLVLADRRWTTRHHVMTLPETQRAVSA